MGYITVADVRDFLRNDEFTDIQIQAMIDRISGMVDEAIGHTAGTPETVTHYFNGNGENKLMLYKYPVVSVSGVAYYTGFGWKAYDASAIDIINDRIIQLRYSPTHPYQYFPEGINNIKVTYTFGYSTVPNWIKDYVLLKVADELVPGEYSEALKRAEEAFNQNALI